MNKILDIKEKQSLVVHVHFDKGCQNQFIIQQLYSDKASDHRALTVNRVKLFLTFHALLTNQIVGPIIKTGLTQVSISEQVTRLSLLSPKYIRKCHIIVWMDLYLYENIFSGISEFVPSRPDLRVYFCHLSTCVNPSLFIQNKKRRQL